MHKDEAIIDIPLVYQLIKSQFPQWANLPIEPIRSAGTDHAIFRLGEELAIRLPRIIGATEQIHKEQHWLPRLAPHLPLKISTPIAKGKPDAGYPWHWSIYEWLEGENATLQPVDDPIQAAKDMAEFIIALQKIDPSGAPIPGSHNFGRGVPLAARDANTRQNIAALDGMIDTAAATAIWESALKCPIWDQPPVWIHGGKLSAVIDFGGLAVGDPACDLQLAWNYFTGEARQIFREMLAVNDATWIRGRGWVLSIGIIALPYYQETNPVLAGIARRAIDAVIEDYRLTG